MGSILLTGATGFLGSHILRGILDRRHDNVIVLKRSFSNLFRIEDIIKSDRVKFYDVDKVDLKVIFQENKIDTIIHCATNYGRKDSDVMNILESNLMFPLKILKLGVLHGVKNFINTDTIIDKKINHYSLSKKQFLDWLVDSSSQITAINLALEHFYGPFDNDSKFTTFIFHKLLENAVSIDLTKGEQKRHFIYIDDVVDAFIKILDDLNSIPKGYSSYEVSTEESISIKDFVELCKKITKNTSTNLNFGALPYRENELMDCKTDISALKKLGWSPKTSLEVGIIKTLNEERIK